jgi:hypothetical protein
MCLDRDKITEIFVLADEFCIGFNEIDLCVLWEINPRKSPKLAR